MILQELNTKEAEAFMAIIKEFIKIDNNFHAEEKALLEKYISKLNLSSKDIEHTNIQEAKEILMTASDNNKKIMYFTLLGIALVDGEYETTEIDYLESLAEEFKISRATKIAFANFYFDYDKLKELSEEQIDAKMKEVLM